MAYQITSKTYGEYPSVEAIVDATTMADPSGLPAEWPAGSIIYTTGYETIKTKGLDGAWTEVAQ